MVKLLFISERIEDIDTIKKCLLDEVMFVQYNPLTDNFSKLEKFISNEFVKDNKITNVGWIFHSPSNLEDENTDIMLFKDIELSKKVKKNSLKKLIWFFKIIENIIDDPNPRFDLLACCLLKNPVFINIRDQILEEMKHEGCKLTIAASDNLTGSVYHGQEQDWILESHNVDLVGLYFNQNINDYCFNFKGNPISNIQENIGNATMAAASGDWEGAVNSLGSAVLMVPTTLPIVDGIKKTYEVLQDPGVQAIFDCIPGLNLVSYTVRMTKFIEKAANGNLNDWDIALCVLDSVSLAAGFAVPGGNASSAVVKSAVRSTGNISKVKNLAKSSLGVLKYGKDIGEITQKLVEEPNEGSIDDVALSVAKVAVSAGISKGKMKEQLKVALDSGNAAGFYAISEIMKKSEASYDSIQQKLINEPGAILYEHTSYNGISYVLKRGTSSVSFGNFTNKCSSLKIPPRTAVRLWEKNNYQGEYQDYCNWNWFDMNINWIGNMNDKFASGICVEIRQDGSVAWEI
jgi:hypothetical protein